MIKEKFASAFMDVAERFAQLSSARRAQVGAIIVKDNRIISIGYNGMPSGWDNNCEHEDWPDWIKTNPEIPRDPAYVRLKTKPEVLHAERNALDKLARSTESGENSVMFVTHSPCLECAKSIYGAGISEVYYRTNYRDNAGIEFLEKCGVNIHKCK